jgi:type I restriction enzyme S subunit
MNQFKKYSFPLPPLPIQEEIVRILDTFTELQARKNQYEYYRDKLLTFNNKRERVIWTSLGEIGNVVMCKRIMKAETMPEGDILFYKIGTFG